MQLTGGTKTSNRALQQNLQIIEQKTANVFMDEGKYRCTCLIPKS